MLVFKDGFPGVPRFSGLLDYLQLCQVGVSIRSDTLECILHKQSEDHWSGYDNEHPPITCRELVQEVRAVLREDEPGCDVDKVFVTMEPIDKVAIKREVVAAGEEDEDEEKRRRQAAQALQRWWCASWTARTAQRSGQKMAK